MVDHPRHVFVSYTHDQERAADALVDQLRAKGAAPSSIDESRVGEDWRAQLQDTVANADSFVVLIGKDPSRYDRAEWTAVLEESWADPDKPVVAVLGPEATLPPAFADRQAIVLAESGDVADQVQSLVPEILAAFNKSAEQYPFLDSSVSSSWGERLDAIHSASQVTDDEASED
jgi:hypothetical protein